MFRKLAIAAAAVLTIGAAAFSPSTAEAKKIIIIKPFPHHNHFHGGFYGGPVFAGGPCWVKRIVPTPFGPRFRWVNVCW